MVQSDLILIVVTQILSGRADDSVSDLSVEYSVTVDTVRVNQGRAILTEVVEYLDDLVGR